MRLPFLCAAALLFGAAAAAAAAAPLRDRHIAVVAHELSFTGAPLTAIDLAVLFNAGGATASLLVLGPVDDRVIGRARNMGVQHVLRTGSRPAAAPTADLVVVVSLAAAPWIHAVARADPLLLRRTVWYAVDEFTVPALPYLSTVRAVVTPSRFVAGLHNNLDTPPAVLAPPSKRVPALSPAEREALGDATRARLGIPQGSCVFLMAGTVTPKKGQHLAIEAARVIAERAPRAVFHLVVVGAAENSTDVGGRVVVVERVTDIEPFYAAADVFVMNSLSEAFGMVTVEALARGLPVLGTTSGATPELVVDGASGLLHPPGPDGVPVLAEHMAKMISSPFVRRALGRQARADALRRFRDDVVAAQWIGLAESVLAEIPSRGPPLASAPIRLPQRGMARLSLFREAYPDLDTYVRRFALDHGLGAEAGDDMVQRARALPSAAQVEPASAPWPPGVPPTLPECAAIAKGWTLVAMETEAHVAALESWNGLQPAPRIVASSVPADAGRPLVFVRPDIVLEQRMLDDMQVACTFFAPSPVVIGWQRAEDTVGAVAVVGAWTPDTTETLEDLVVGAKGAGLPIVDGSFAVPLRSAAGLRMDAAGRPFARLIDVATARLGNQSTGTEVLLAIPS